MRANTAIKLLLNLQSLEGWSSQAPSFKTELFSAVNRDFLTAGLNIPKIYYFKALQLAGYSATNIARLLTESSNAGQVGNGLRRLQSVTLSSVQALDNWTPLTQQQVQKISAMIMVLGGVRTRGSASRTWARPTTTTSTRTSTAAATSAEGLVRDVPFTGTIGAEFEIFGPTRAEIIQAYRDKKLNIESESYNHTTRSYWKIVMDASVTGSNGCEVVSPVLTGTKGLVELRKALQALAACGALVNRSTGLHIHFGARGLSLQQWKNLLINYHGLEPIIDDMMQQTRRNNQYARSLRDISGFVQKVQDADNFNELRSILGTRYRKVNLESYDRHGTVEFRQHAGNVEIDSVINWVLFLHYLIEVSKRRTLTQFTFKNIENFVPKPLASWIHNRIYDLSNKNYKD